MLSAAVYEVPLLKLILFSVSLQMICNEYTEWWKFSFSCKSLIILYFNSLILFIQDM
jgi:hypothetical protein